MGIEISKKSNTSSTGGMTKVYDEESTAGQTSFTVTGHTLTDDFLLLIDDMPQTKIPTRSGNTVNYPPGCKKGQNIVIFN